MEKMVGTKLIEHIRANIADTCQYIKDVEPIWREGSLEGTDDLRGIKLTLDDSVKTQITFSVFQDKLLVELSQMEPIPTRVPYIKNY